MIRGLNRLLRSRKTLPLIVIVFIAAICGVVGAWYAIAPLSYISLALWALLSMAGMGLLLFGMTARDVKGDAGARDEAPAQRPRTGAEPNEHRSIITWITVLSSILFMMQLASDRGYRTGGRDELLEKINSGVEQIQKGESTIVLTGERLGYGQDRLQADSDDLARGLDAVSTSLGRVSVLQDEIHRCIEDVRDFQNRVQWLANSVPEWQQRTEDSLRAVRDEVKAMEAWLVSISERVQSGSGR